MSEPMLAVQTAIYANLTADPTLTALADVYDEVPEGAAMPYVTIGQVDTEVPEDAHDRSGWSMTETLHIWSRYRGYREAAEILAEVDRVLHRQPLDVPGFIVVSVTHEFHQSLRDPDPQVRHIPARYRIRLEEDLTP